MDIQKTRLGLLRRLQAWVLNKIQPPTPVVEAEVRTPAVGEKWLRKQEGPHASQYFYYVEILGCRHGRVRYYMNFMYEDETVNLDIFLMLYEPVERPS